MSPCIIVTIFCFPPWRLTGVSSTPGYTRNLAPCHPQYTDSQLQLHLPPLPPPPPPLLLPPSDGLTSPGPQVRDGQTARDTLPSPGNFTPY